MANQTITANTNYDSASISGLLNGENITVNAGTLTINSDVRWGQQAAVLGTLTINLGSAILDGRDVWWVPFSGATGNIPALGTVGTPDVTRGGSNVGEFLGVWTALGVAPSAAGGAMPASGFIKFRITTATFAASDVLTFANGATATLTGAGQRGWIHFVGREGNGTSVARLGSFLVRGDWFELGTTSGADDQTFQYPVTDACPAIQIETSAGSGVFEWYVNSGGRWGQATASVSTDARGKMFGQNVSTGVITIAQRATNTCGFKPPTGCIVRIPNVIMSSAAAADYSVNTLNATLSNRWRPSIGSGAFDIDRACSAQYLFAQGAASLNVVDSAFLASMAFTGCATAVTLTRVGVGNTGTAAFNWISYTSSFFGLTATDCYGLSHEISPSTIGVSCSNVQAVNFTRVKSVVLPVAGARGFGNSAFSLSTVSGLTMTDCEAIGGNVSLTTVATSSIAGTRYADQTIGETTNTAALSGIIVATLSTDTVISGFSEFAGIANNSPRNAIVRIVQSCKRATVSDIGTVASPYNCGTGSFPCGIVLEVANVSELTARRIYTINAATTIYAGTSNTEQVSLINVWGDGGDNVTNVGNNNVIRGCRATNSTAGQTGAYGSIFADLFTSATAGRIVVFGNEPSAATASQVTTSFTSGAGFNGSGSIALPNVGNTVTWDMPYFALGHTRLANTTPTVTGANSGNYSFEFQWDTGSGYNGTWLALTGANLFGVGAIDPATGIALKIRLTVNTANSATTFTNLRIDTTTDSVSQQTQYPLPGIPVTVNGLVAGSRVKITRTDTDALLVNQLVGGTSQVFDLTYTGQVRVEARHASGSPAYKPWFTILTVGTGATVTVLQEED
jgi:hypothetical protein